MATAPGELDLVLDLLGFDFDDQEWDWHFFRVVLELTKDLPGLRPCKEEAVHLSVVKVKSSYNVFHGKLVFQIGCSRFKLFFCEGGGPGLLFFAALLSDLGDLKELVVLLLDVGSLKLTHVGYHGFLESASNPQLSVPPSIPTLVVLW